MTHRIIIPAAGKQTRWEGDGSKHFVDVLGEPLIIRTIRQLLDRKKSEIIVLSDKGWNLGVPCISPQQRADVAETDKILSSVPYWTDADRLDKTTLLFGDVCFTDKAMDTIVAAGAKKCTWFGRRNASKKTGKPYGEIFGVTIAKSYSDVFAKFCETVRKQRDVAQLMKEPRNRKHWQKRWADSRRRVHERRRGTARTCYEAMASTPWTKYVEIDDMTEDFDYIEDYTTWLARLENA